MTVAQPANILEGVVGAGIGWLSAEQQRKQAIADRRAAEATARAAEIGLQAETQRNRQVLLWGLLAVAVVVFLLLLAKRRP